MAVRICNSSWKGAIHLWQLLISYSANWMDNQKTFAITSSRNNIAIQEATEAAKNKVHKYFSMD